MSRDAAIATIRFGLGPRVNEIAEAAPDPRGWLKAQVANPPSIPPSLNEAIPGVGPALATTIEQQRTQPTPNPVQASYRASMEALSGHWTTTDQPFLEHWALFWANHLTVSLRSGNVGALIGDYFLRAIRPNCLGPFRDLLLAAIRHPAMVRYLDNAQSTGPNSQAGQRQRRGLNENLGREILELHTLSPAGGYSQGDVTQLATIITGWSAGNPDPGGFVFRERMHEPGEKHLLGRTFEEGEQAGIEALSMLATHPATARFLAMKLARHFIADDPPADAVSAIEARLRDTDLHLGEVAAAIINLEAAWRQPLSKLRRPDELVIAALRATGDPLPPAARIGAFAMLGQPLFVAPAPNGWPDVAEAWVAPEALMRRIEWASGLAGRLADPPDPRALLTDSLGPLASSGLASAVRGAETRREGVMLVLASPQFQRR